MTSAGRLPGTGHGPTNPFSGIMKLAAGVVELTVGLFVFAVSATFLLFAVLAIAIVGLIAVGVFWARARLTGRPFGPREHLEAMMMAQMQPQMQAAPVRFTDDGPVIDAHQTPDGWSVEH